MRVTINKVSLLFSLAITMYGSIMFASSYSMLPQSRQIIQWVKITSSLDKDLFSKIRVYNLEAAFIDCGYQCQLIKLNTTPFNVQGKLKIALIGRYCGKEGSIDIPFNINDGYLTTPINTYHVKVEGGYCGLSKVDVVVSGNPRSNEGYSIELISK